MATFSLHGSTVGTSFRHSAWLARLYSLIYGFHSLVRGRDNRVIRHNSILRRTQLNISGDNCEVILGDRVRIWDSTITLTGSRCRLLIGDNCALRNVCLVVEDSDSLLSIGADTTMTKTTVVAQEGRRIRIGEDCMIAQQSVIRSGDGHSILLEQTGQRINRAGDIDVGNHVWVGIGALVMENSRLESGCIIGAGALVKNADIPAASVAVGVPARVVREGIRWSRERL